MRLEV